MQNNKSRKLPLVTKLLLMGCVALLASSCSLFERLPPVEPPVPEQTQPSFDGNKQDSGLILVDAQRGALVTSRFIERYDALVERYGKDPRHALPVKKRQGVTPVDVDMAMQYQDRGGVYWLDHASLLLFIRMNQWRREVSAVTAPSK